MGNQQSQAQGNQTVTNLLQTYCVLRTKDENQMTRLKDPEQIPILDVRSGATPHIVEYQAPPESKSIKHKAVKQSHGRNHFTPQKSPLSNNLKTQPSQNSGSPSTPKLRVSQESMKPKGSAVSSKSKGSKGSKGLSPKSAIQIKDGKVVRSVNEQPSPIQVYNILSAKEQKRDPSTEIKITVKSKKASKTSKLRKSSQPSIPDQKSVMSQKSYYDLMDNYEIYTCSLQESLDQQSKGKKKQLQKPVDAVLNQPEAIQWPSQAQNRVETDLIQSPSPLIFENAPDDRDNDFDSPKIVKTKPKQKQPSGSDYKFGSDIQIDIFDSKEPIQQPVKKPMQVISYEPVDAPIPAIPTFMRQKQKKVKSSKNGSPDQFRQSFPEPVNKKKDPISQSLAVRLSEGGTYLTVVSSLKKEFQLQKPAICFDLRQVGKILKLSKNKSPKKSKNVNQSRASSLNQLMREQSPSKSPVRTIFKDFGPKGKDPISKSLALRMAEGTYLSVVTQLRQTEKQEYQEVFNLRQVGGSPKLKKKKKTSYLQSQVYNQRSKSQNPLMSDNNSYLISPTRSKKKNSGFKLGDPIGKSLAQRKAIGTYLSVVTELRSNDPKNQPVVFQLRQKGKDPELRKSRAKGQQKARTRTHTKSSSHSSPSVPQKKFKSDPIAAAIKQRKDYGTILSRVPISNFVDEPEIFKLRQVSRIRQQVVTESQNEAISINTLDHHFWEGGEAEEIDIDIFHGNNYQQIVQNQADLVTPNFSNPNMLIYEQQIASLSSKKQFNQLYDSKESPPQIQKKYDQDSFNQEKQSDQDKDVSSGNSSEDSSFPIPLTPAECHNVICHLFNQVLLLKDRGVPFHVTLSQVQKLLQNQDGFQQIKDKNSYLYNLISSLQEQIQMSSEEQHNYPVDPFLNWENPFFKHINQDNQQSPGPPNALSTNIKNMSYQYDTESSDGQNKKNLIMKQKLLSKARLSLLFLTWNKYQTPRQKADLLFELVKSYQNVLKQTVEKQQSTNLAAPTPSEIPKIRTQHNITRDLLSIMLFLSTGFFSRLSPQLERFTCEKDYIQTKNQDESDKPKIPSFGEVLIQAYMEQISRKQKLNQVQDVNWISQKVKRDLMEVYKQMVDDVALAIYQEDDLEIENEEKTAVIEVAGSQVPSRNQIDQRTKINTPYFVQNSIQNDDVQAVNKPSVKGKSNEFEYKQRIIQQSKLRSSPHYGYKQKNPSPQQQQREISFNDAPSSIMLDYQHQADICENPFYEGGSLYEGGNPQKRSPRGKKLGKKGGQIPARYANILDDLSLPDPDSGGTKEVTPKKELNTDRQDRDEELKMLDQISTGLDKFYKSANGKRYRDNAKMSPKNQKTRKNQGLQQGVKGTKKSIQASDVALQNQIKKGLPASRNSIQHVGNATSMQKGLIVPIKGRNPTTKKAIIQSVHLSQSGYETQKSPNQRSKHSIHSNIFSKNFMGSGLLKRESIPQDHKSSSSPIRNRPEDSDQTQKTAQRARKIQTLQRDVWISRVQSKECCWIMYSQQIRQKILENLINKWEQGPN